VFVEVGIFEDWDVYVVRYLIWLWICLSCVSLQYENVVLIVI